VSAVLAWPERLDGVPIVRRIVGFVRLLRDNGFRLGLAETRDAARLARAVDLSRPEPLRQGLRALLCGSAADWARYDALFEAWWLGRFMRSVTRVSGQPSRKPFRKLPGFGAPAGSPGPADRVEDDTSGNPADGAGRRGGASASESLAVKDLRHIDDPDELARVYALTERLAARMRDRLSRRERARPRGRRLDLRGTIHKSIATGGTPIRLVARQRRTRPLRLVVLLDISGSMSQYSSFFVRFIRGVVDHFAEADAFLFHTRLIHVADTLRERDMARALDRLSLIAAGWEGGTRIGESLAEFNRHHARRALNGRTVVMIVSDGYDKGDPARLGRELAEIRRRCRRIVWLNPMLGRPGYAPVAGGMVAALPYIDLFAPAHNLASLAALEPMLATL
jgi:uncharacterized protein with von Willebrand factor type A (vWA) domain